MKNIKKPLAVILAFVLLLGSFPGSAFAQDSAYDIADATSPPVVEEDTSGGADLAETPEAPAEEPNGAEDYNTLGDSDTVPDVAPPASVPSEGEAAEEAVSQAYIGIAPLSTDLSAFDVHIGTPVTATLPVNRDALGLGQIWIGQTIYYPEISTGVYEGTVEVTIYVWGNPFAPGASLLEHGVGDESFIHVSTHTGDFAVLSHTAPPGVTPYFVPGDRGVITWDISEDVIIDPDHPLALTYVLYLEDRPFGPVFDDWETNFWYSTRGSILEVRFEPNMDNPFYWTTEEVEYPAFQITANWNNGSGLNSATITDNELGITFSFGKNTSPENRTAEELPYLGNQSLWAPNDYVRIVHDNGDVDRRPWFLQWSKSMNYDNTPPTKDYYFTIYNFREVDGALQSVTYLVQLDGPGGNKAGPGSRTISSLTWFRRTTLPDGYEWDGDYLVFRASNVAQIMLTNPLEEPSPTGSLQITKRIQAIYPDQEWFFMDGSWQFTMRLMAGDFADALTGGGDYIMLDEVSPGVYSFRGFVGDSAQATTLVFSGADATSLATVTIHDLPTHRHFGDPAPLDYWVYEFFLFETLDLIRVHYCLTGDGEDINETTHHPAEGVYVTSPFNIYPETTRTIKLVNEYDHGIGFLNVFKLLDGFPNDWDVDDETVFYVRIWDVDAGNFLLFYPDAIVYDDDYDWLPIYAGRFEGTHWCVGNHEVGLTSRNYAEPYFDAKGELMVPVMELPLTVDQRLRLSNLWTGFEYQVFEVERVVLPTDADADAAADRADAAWLDFWNTQGSTGRIPVWEGGTYNGAWVNTDWIGWENGVAGTEVVGSDFWRPVREIADHLGGDVAWHDDKDWDWGVIYDPEDNPSAALRFNLTETVTITNRYKFHGGDIVFTKDLGDYAEAWGMTADTLFHARVRADDGRLLVFVEDDADDYPEDTVWRVIGFVNESTGAYQVLCPVGGANAPPHARTILSFSQASATRLIEVPVHPFAPYDDMLFTIEEVFPASLPLPNGNLLPDLDTGILGFDFEEIAVTDHEGFVVTDWPFNMIDNEARTVTITNHFEEVYGNLVIYKELYENGFYEDWGADTETLFYASVFRDDVLLWFVPIDGGFVLVGSPNFDDFVTPPAAEPISVIPFSADNPAVLIGLSVYYYRYEVIEVDEEGEDLPAPEEIGFEWEAAGVEIDETNNLFETIINTFLPVYRVFYHPNGGTGTMIDEDNPYQPGDTVILLNNTFTRAGWTFIGWNTAADRSGTTYAEGDTYIMGNADVTFYAQWRQSTTPPEPPDPPRPPDPPIPPPGGFFVDEHIWYLRGYDEGYLRPANIDVQNPNAFTMRPDANITRAEVAMVFYRLLRPEFKDFVPEDVPFIDVQGNEWFGLAAGILTHHGIFEGNGGLFRPHDPITRRELAVVVSRFDNLAETSVNPYTDVSPSDWAYRYILSATARGWFIGFPDGTFRPGSNLTRAEFATATNRVLERRILLEHIPDDVVEFIDMDGTHWAHADFMEAAHSHDWELHDNGITERWLAITGHGLDAAYNQ